MASDYIYKNIYKYDKVTHKETDLSWDLIKKEMMKEKLTRNLNHHLYCITQKS